MGSRALHNCLRGMRQGIPLVISRMVCNLSILGSILKGMVSVCYFAHGTERDGRILSSKVQDARWWVEERLPHHQQQKDLLRSSMTGQSGLGTRDRADFLVVIARPKTRWVRSATR